MRADAIAWLLLVRGTAGRPAVGTWQVGNVDWLSCPERARTENVTVTRTSVICFSRETRLLGFLCSDTFLPTDICGAVMLVCAFVCHLWLSVQLWFTVPRSLGRADSHVYRAEPDCRFTRLEGSRSAGLWAGGSCYLHSTVAACFARSGATGRLRHAQQAIICSETAGLGFNHRRAGCAFLGSGMECQFGPRATASTHKVLAVPDLLPKVRYRVY